MSGAAACAGRQDNDVDVIVMLVCDVVVISKAECSGLSTHWPIIGQPNFRKQLFITQSRPKRQDNHKPAAVVELKT